MRCLPHGKSGRHLRTDELVELLGLDVCFLQECRFHAAADIDAHQIRDELIGDSHGRADGAAGSGVDIGHDADLRALRKGLIAQLLDLCDCTGVDAVRKNSGACLGAVDREHGLLLFSRLPEDTKRALLLTQKRP